MRGTTGHSGRLPRRMLQPEVLNLARQIRAFPAKVSSDLTRRIEAADRTTRRLDQQQRMASSLVCPLIENDHCVAYAVRPLACRGHASYDEGACRDALQGGASEVPISALHLTVRSLVQNAMQSALRDAGLAWGTYELNQALQIALCDEASERAWMAGSDVFAPALITDVSLREMAETFDAIKAIAASAGLSTGDLPRIRIELKSVSEGRSKLAARGQVASSATLRPQIIAFILEIDRAYSFCREGLSSSPRTTQSVHGDPRL
jgi:hypothetical protein